MRSCLKLRAWYGLSRYILLIADVYSLTPELLTLSCDQGLDYVDKSEQKQQHDQYQKQQT